MEDSWIPAAWTKDGFVIDHSNPTSLDINASLQE